MEKLNLNVRVNFVYQYFIIFSYVWYSVRSVCLKSHCDFRFVQSGVSLITRVAKVLLRVTNRLLLRIMQENIRENLFGIRRELRTRNIT